MKHAHRRQSENIQVSVLGQGYLGSLVRMPSSIGYVNVLFWNTQADSTNESVHDFDLTV